VTLFVVITRPHNNDRWHRHATVYVIINYNLKRASGVSRSKRRCCVDNLSSIGNEQGDDDLSLYLLHFGINEFR